jgi:hypothetical protein
MRKKFIVLFNSPLHGGGVEQVVAHLLKALLKSVTETWFLEIIHLFSFRDTLYKKYLKITIPYKSKNGYITEIFVFFNNLNKIFFNLKFASFTIPM